MHKTKTRSACSGGASLVFDTKLAVCWTVEMIHFLKRTQRLDCSVVWWLSIPWPFQVQLKRTKLMFWNWGFYLLLSLVLIFFGITLRLYRASRYIECDGVKKYISTLRDYSIFSLTRWFISLLSQPHFWEAGVSLVGEMHLVFLSLFLHLTKIFPLYRWSKYFGVQVA